MTSAATPPSSDKGKPDSSMSSSLTSHPPVASSERKKKAMEINEAYESLEKMRKLNLELECQEKGIPLSDKDYDRCKTCLFQPPKNEESFVSSLVPTGMKRKSKATPCLICATPCCTSHCSKTFRQESLVVCCDCEQVFTLDFVVDCLTNSEEKLKPAIDSVVDLYDRTVLLLSYSAPFVPDLCKQLNEEEKRQNLTTFGASTVGVASSLVGVATFVTPVGPPLLVGALFFGTGATAVQVGSDARYFSLPALQMANRILTLEGMLKSILRVRDTLGAAASALHDDYSNAVRSPQQQQQQQSTSGTTVRKGSTTNGTKKDDTFLGVTTGRVLKKGIGHIMASTTLSGLFLLWDSKNLSNTVTAIRKGSPSDKAEKLQGIPHQLQEMPTAEGLDEELQRYAMAIQQKNPHTISKEAAMQIALDVEGVKPSVAAAVQNEPIHHVSTTEEEGTSMQETPTNTSLQEEETK